MALRPWPLGPWPCGHLHHLGGTTAASCSAATLSCPSWWLTSVLASATPSLWFSSQQPSGAALAYEAFWNSVFTTDTFKRHYKWLGQTAGESSSLVTYRGLAERFKAQTKDKKKNMSQDISCIGTVNCSCCIYVLQMPPLLHGGVFGYILLCKCGWHLL
jgi:hypothetical protein